MMNVRRLVVTSAVAGAFVAVASPAVAQICAGTPLVSQGQTAVALRGSFPEYANVFGARAFNRVTEPVTVGVSYDLTSPEFGDASHTIGGHVLFDLPVAALEASGVSLCPAASLYYSRMDDINSLQVPLGVSVGASFSVGEGIAVAPYAFPALHWMRVSHDGHSHSDTEFGIEVGGNVVVNNLFFGAFLSKIGEGDGGASLGVQAGFTTR